MDVAALGVSVDADGVLKGATALDKFADSAGKADRSAAAATTGAQKLGGGVSKAATEAARAAGSVDKYAASATAATAAQNTLAMAAESAGRSFQQADAHVQAYQNQLRVANDNVGRLQSNTGNIAAQFQDIGVTAAMGMNPLLIALQQGTQLSAVFAQSGQSMGASLVGAFKQIASVQAIMTIAVVAGAAALIQLATSFFEADDSAKKAKDTIKDLAQQFNFATVSAKQLKEINELLAAANRDIERTAIGAANATWQQAAANRDAAQATLRMAKAEYERISAFSSDPTFAEGNLAYAGQLSRIEGKTKQLTLAIDGFDRQARGAAFSSRVLAAGMDENAKKAEALRSRINQLNREYEGSRSPARQQAILQEALTAQKRLDAIKPNQRASDKAAREAATAARSEARKAESEAERAAKKAAETIAKFNEANDKQTRGYEQAAERAGLYGRALTYVTELQERHNRASDAGIKVTGAMAQAFSEQAAAAADMAAANAQQKFMADLARDTELATFALERQRGELFLTGAALEAYRATTEAMSAAMRDGITLRDSDIASIQRQAGALAASREQIAQTAADWQKIIDGAKAVGTDFMKAQEAQLQAARQVVGGFFSEWEKGMRSGKSAVDSFADAAVNALNRIADRLMDQTINGFLDMILGASGSGAGGGLLGSLLGGGGSGVTGGSSGFGFDFGSMTDFDPVIMNARGGVYGSPERFAKGGSFTNSIVTSPTLFRFAKGSALGEMGEAGPEAIMPLKRGANGALGVQMHGGAQRVDLIVRAEPGEMFRPIVEDISQNKAIQVTQAGLQAYDAQMPNRFQQIASDERMR